MPKPSSFAHHPHSLGHYLCVHPSGAPYEDIDTISLPDLKQDACLRALIALHRAGKPLTPTDDPITAFDADEGLVRRAYTFALRDALRQQLGRGVIRGRRLARWQRRLSLDHGFEEVADPAQQEALDIIVEQVTATTRLLLLWNEGFGGLSTTRARKLLRLLRQLQRRKAEGSTVVSNDLRLRLKRLRRGTGLPLSTRDL
jgi:hypothetical protein